MFITHEITDPLLVADLREERLAKANKATCDAQRAYEGAQSHPDSVKALAKSDAMRDIANELWRELGLDES